MKKKRSYKFMLIICCFLCIMITTVGYSAYIVRTDIGDIAGVISPDANKNLNKVVFKDNLDNIIDTVYVQSGAAIDSSNTPLMGTKRIKWHENDANGIVKLDLCDKNKTSFIPTNRSTVLVGVEDTTKDTLGNVVTDKNTSNGNPNGSNTTINGNNITLVEKTSADKNNLCNDITIGGSLENITLDSKYIGKNGKNEIQNNVKAGGNNQFNCDTTIGLEDPAAKKSLYKPFAGGTGVNYCVSRITLDSDLILNNSILNIGAMTGFYGTQNNWTQHNMQGIIMGNYSEIDLNGHNLIVGNGSTLNAYGSITDSSPDRTGKVIVDNGGTLLSTFVVESNNYDKGLATLYYNGGEIFDSYRCPYLDCSIRINYGARFNLILRIDFAGKDSTCISEILKFIGPDNSSILTLSSGYIERSVTYDDNVYKINNNFMKQNLMHQVIKYDIYDCQNLYFNHIILSLQIGVIPFKFHLLKNNFLIPAYYQIYLHNSKFTTAINLTFISGSYLYVDSKSTVNFTSTQLTDDYVAKFPPVGFENNYLYQCVGGLNFVNEICDYKEAVNNSKNNKYAVGWVDNVHDSKNNGDNGGSTRIHSQSTEFASYCNKYRRAHCDMLGSITFEKNIDRFNNLSIPYKIGGEINISDVEKFKNTVNARNDVLLYSSNPRFGPCTAFAPGLSFGSQSINIIDFCISPLISNNNVLMDFENQGKVREDYSYNNAGYDKSTGLITYYNNTSQLVENYAFIHTDASYSNWDGDITHSNKTDLGIKNRLTNLSTAIDRYLAGKDSNYGKFFKVNVNADHSITAPVNANGKTQYIFFRGAFMPYDGTNVYIDKLRAKESNLKNLGTVRPVKYVTNDSYYDHPVWRLG